MFLPERAGHRGHVALLPLCPLVCHSRTVPDSGLQGWAGMSCTSALLCVIRGTSRFAQTFIWEQSV